MILREIKYNVFFEYIKDIRRYNYDIEDFLKNNNLCSNIDFIPPLPDEIEPLAERLSIQKRLDNKLFIFKLSQLSFSIIIIYDENQKIILKDELDYVNNIQERIKNFLKEKIEKFKICYESLAIVKEKLTQNIQEIDILKVSEDLDETTERISKELNDEYFIIKQKSVLKTFNFSETITDQFTLHKNKKENFAGWQIFIQDEVNNRLAYNNDINKSRELNFKEVLEFIEHKGN